MTTDAAPPLAPIRLLDADPGLLEHVSPEEAPVARRMLRVPAVTLAPGPFDPAELFSWGLHTFAALVTEGLVAQEVAVGAQPTLRLLGAGDVLASPRAPAGLVPVVQDWSAAAPTHIALLDDHVLTAVRRWPRLLPALLDRAWEAQGGLLLQLAVAQQPRVEDRLVLLFGALGERWGRMTPAGVVVPLRLTHEALGRLIGARRPTVTLALRGLARQRRLQRRDDGCWLLGDPESEPERAASATTALRPSQRPRFAAPGGGDRVAAGDLQDVRWPVG